MLMYSPNKIWIMDRTMTTKITIKIKSEHIVDIKIPAISAGILLCSTVSIELTYK